MNRSMRLFVALIFLSPIFLSPVILGPGDNQWVAGEACGGKSVVQKSKHQTTSHTHANLATGTQSTTRPTIRRENAKIKSAFESTRWARARLSVRTLAVTGPPPKNYDFKTRVIGGSGSPRTPNMGVNLWGASPLYENGN